MFTSQPWTDYAVVVCTLTVIYYLIVAIRFYRQEIKNLIKRHLSKPDRHFSQHSEPDETTSLEMRQQPVDNSDLSGSETDDHDSGKLSAEREQQFQQLEELAAQLKGDIAEAVAKKYSNQELVLLLQMSIKEYPALHGNPFRFAINNLIDVECAKYGSIHLGENDKVELWIR
jgi:flagellar biosynthesis/type III secretory pathway M-ring protein FliF/YscJ